MQININIQANLEFFGKELAGNTWTRLWMKFQKIRFLEKTGFAIVECMESNGN